MKQHHSVANEQSDEIKHARRRMMEISIDNANHEGMRNEVWGIVKRGIEFINI